MVQLLINSSKNHPFVGIADGNWTLYRVYDDYVTDVNEMALYDSNDVIHYGAFTLGRDLTEADIPNYPDFIRDAIPLLDSSAFACVRSDGTTMLDSPGGQPLAVCYARLTGNVALVCVTSGPGGTNAITGVVGGWQDSIPMFVISGQVKRVRATQPILSPLKANTPAFISY